MYDTTLVIFNVYAGNHVLLNYEVIPLSLYFSMTNQADLNGDFEIMSINIYSDFIEYQKIIQVNYI